MSDGSVLPVGSMGRRVLQVSTDGNVGSEESTRAPPAPSGLRRQGGRSRRITARPDGKATPLINSIIEAEPYIPVPEVDMHFHAGLSGNHLEIGIHGHGGSIGGLDAHVDICNQVPVGAGAEHVTYGFGYHVHSGSDHLPPKLDFGKHVGGIESSHHHGDVPDLTAGGDYRHHSSPAHDPTSSKLPDATSFQTSVLSLKSGYNVLCSLRAGQHARAILHPPPDVNAGDRRYVSGYQRGYQEAATDRPRYGAGLNPQDSEIRRRGYQDGYDARRNAGIFKKGWTVISTALPTGLAYLVSPSYAAAVGAATAGGYFWPSAFQSQPDSRWAKAEVVASYAVPALGVLATGGANIYIVGAVQTCRLAQSWWGR